MHVHEAGLKKFTAATKLGFAPVTAHAVPGTKEAPSKDQGALASWDIANPKSVVILETNTISGPRN